jgi:diguanylate cyclase (GGDEF)-like protein
VADPAAGDRPPASNGASKTQQESSDPASGAEQTLADRSQTLADADQTGSDSDQTAAESDQAAADSDQAASDRDLAHGGDADTHDVTRDLRDRSTEQRRQTAEGRTSAATARDVVAQERDRAALERDRAAALHDRELAAREAGWAPDGRAADNRRRAAADRAAAAEGRARAEADRARAALDREQAARDRAQAQADRDALVLQLAIAEADALTGARLRGPGLADLDREIDRARRTTSELVVAYVDVVGLKAVNDEHGHAAGDALLQRAVAAIRGHLRSYDLIVRVGGDEFLCVMSGATIQDARRRFDAVETTLAGGTIHCEIKIGFAVLAPEESAAELVQRADDDLLTNRQR